MADIPLLTQTHDGDPDGPLRRLTEETFGLIYWANTVIGHALSLSHDAIDPSWVTTLQQHLFVAGHDVNHGTCVVTAEDVSWIRKARLRWAASLPPQNGFILPGGSPAASRWQEVAAILMQARRLFAELARLTPVNVRVAELLDEGSYACFVAGRMINQRAGCQEVAVRTRD